MHEKTMMGNKYSNKILEHTLTHINNSNVTFKVFPTHAAFASKSILQ